MTDPEQPSEIGESDSDDQLPNFEARKTADSTAYFGAFMDYRDSLGRIADLVVPQFADWCSIHIVSPLEKIETICVTRSEEIAKSEEQINKLIILWGGIERVIKSGKAEFTERSNFNTSEKKASLSCVPLLVHGKTLGAVTLFSNERTFTERDLRIFEEVALLAAIAVENAKLYQEAEEAIHTRDDFLSLASHELKTPLTPLKLHFQIMKKMATEGSLAKMPKEKVERMFERSDRQINRITNLVDDLLRVSRINLNRMNFRFRRADLKPLITNVVDRFKDQLKGAGISLTLEARSPIWGFWDSTKLEQVIINLIANAIKYGNRSPIRVSVKLEGQKVIIQVKDSGIGVAKEDQARIFSLFGRAIPGTSYGGLGIGLYVAKNIVDQHGGKISVLSAKGEGSVFTVELPIHGVAKKDMADMETSDQQLNLDFMGPPELALPH